MRNPKEVITSETCRSCGACCVAEHDQPAFCDITEEDEKRLGKRFVRLHVLRPRIIDQLAAQLDRRYVPDGAIATKWRTQKTGPLKGAEACMCFALRGSVMSQVSCSVYEKRPDVCRNAVIPGDKTCRAIRREYKDLVEDFTA